MKPSSVDYGLADLHIHSTFSDGIAGVAEVLDYVQEHTRLDVIAIADHATLQGSLLAQEMAARHNYRFQVVPAMEVATKNGHLLALFIERPAPSDEPLFATIQAVHAQGGLCVLAHPMSRQRDSVDRLSLERLLAGGDDTAKPDGLEILDPRVARLMNVEDVERLNREQYHLAELGNSDAHAPSIIATRYTIFRGKGAEGLRDSIRNRTTRAWSGQALPPDLCNAT